MRSITYIFFTMCILWCNATYSFESNTITTDVRYEASMNEFGKPFVDQMITNQSGVFLRVGDCWIVAAGLYASSDGLFVLIYGNWMTVEEALEIPECKLKTWVCSRCKFINYEGVNVCGVCGKPRYS